MEQAVSDRPREFWIDPVGDTVDGEFDAIVCDKEPPHIAIHVIEYAAYDKLLTEVISLRLQKDPDIVDGVKDVTIAALKNTETRVRADRDKIREEHDTLKAKLAEVEAELKKAQGIAWDRKCELRKEREAARVMREALDYYASSVPLGREARVAIAKADEIRGDQTKMPCPDKDIDPLG